MIRLSNYGVTEIFEIYSQLIKELRHRKILRTSNNPAGDYAEYLCTKAFKWILAPKGSKGFDAYFKRTRYEIKSRRITSENKTRYITGIRDIEGEHFHYLAVVVFNENFSINEAYLIPRIVVVNKSKLIRHTNSRTLILTDEVIGLAKNITKELTRASKAQKLARRS